MSKLSEEIEEAIDIASRPESRLHCAPLGEVRLRRWAEEFGQLEAQLAERAAEVERLKAEINQFLAQGPLINDWAQHERGDAVGNADVTVEVRISALQKLKAALRGEEVKA